MEINNIDVNESLAEFGNVDDGSSMSVIMHDSLVQFDKYIPAEDPLYVNISRSLMAFSNEEDKPMATTFALEWDAQGQKQYELGVKQGVLYKYDSTAQKWYGVAWNGLTSVSESPDGAEENELWADNIKYGGIRSAEKFSGSIEAYTYPEEFEGCDGLARPDGSVGITIGQQKREVFCLSYRTEIGNDQDPEAGYRIHLVYNATCSPSEKSYETINDSPDAITFSWDFDTTPLNVKGYKPTSHICIDSTDFDTQEKKALLTALENKIYGTKDGSTIVKAELPLPDDLIEMMTP